MTPAPLKLERYRGRPARRWPLWLLLLCILATLAMLWACLLVLGVAPESVAPH